MFGKVGRIKWDVKEINYELVRQGIMGVLTETGVENVPQDRQVDIPRLEKIIAALLEYHSLEWQTLEQNKMSPKGCLVKKAKVEEQGV